MSSELNPADFKYCVEIKTMLGKTMYGLTNENNITFGHVLDMINERVKYKNYTVKFNNIFLAIDDEVMYDLEERIPFKDNKACVSMVETKNDNRPEDIILQEQYNTHLNEMCDLSEEHKFFKNRVSNRNLMKVKKSIYDGIDFEDYGYDYIADKNVTYRKQIIGGIIIANKKLKSELEEYKKALYESCKDDESRIQVFVKTLTGRTIVVDVGKHQMIDHLKEKIEIKTETPVNQQKLIYAGKHLSNGYDLKDYKIGPQSTVHLVLNLRGGMYQESSGRNGNYEPLDDLYFSLD